MLSANDITAKADGFRILSRVFILEADDKLISALQDKDLHETFSFVKNSPFLKEGLAKLDVYLAGPIDLQSLRVAFAALFLGPGTLKAPRWGSVYQSPTGVLMPSEILHIRAFYARFGLAVENSAEPDDSIAFELGFLGYLYDALAKEADEDMRKLISEAIIEFREENLDLWVGKFAEAVIQGDTSGFYTGFALILKALIPCKL